MTDAAASTRPEVMRLAEVFSATVVDVSRTTLLLQCVEHPDRLRALEELLSPYGILEAVRTGRVAMRRADVPSDPTGAHPPTAG